MWNHAAIFTPRPRVFIFCKQVLLVPIRSRITTVQMWGYGSLHFGIHSAVNSHVINKPQWARPIGSHAHGMFHTWCSMFGFSGCSFPSPYFPHHSDTKWGTNHAKRHIILIWRLAWLHLSKAYGFRRGCFSFLFLIWCFHPIPVFQVWDLFEL